MVLVCIIVKDECVCLIDGLSLFYIDFNWDYVDVRCILKMGCVVVDFNEFFFDGLFVLEEDWIGEEGKGFYYLFYGFNLECVLIGVEVIGVGECVLEKVFCYVFEWVVFDWLIG